MGIYMLYEKQRDPLIFSAMMGKEPLVILPYIPSMSIQISQEQSMENQLPILPKSMDLMDVSYLPSFPFQ